ncbi:MAG: AsmA family protein [Gammaproteobacteria bacterium]|nr:AsmA family protein [Gammaproteobacteria bacterium]
MKRLIWILTLSLAGLVLIAGIGLAVFVATFDANRYKGELVELVERQTDRDFAVEGEISLVPSLEPTVALEGVTLGNAGWGSGEPMLALDRLEVQISLLPLLRRELVISRLLLDAPVIHLETGPEGRGNWQLGERAAEAAPADRELPALDIHEVRITDAVIRYHAHGDETARQFDIDHLGMYVESPGQPLQIDLRVDHRDHTLAATGELGSLRGLIAGEPFAVNLDIHLDEIRASLDGTIDQPATLVGTGFDITATANSLAAIGRLMDRDLPPLEPVRVSGRLDVTADDQYRLTGLDLRAGESDLRGTATLRLGEGRPHVAAELHAKHLDTRPFQPEEKAETKKGGKVFSPEPFSVSGLQAVEAEITLKADRLTTRGAILEDLDTQLVLTQDRLQIDPLTAKLAGGRLNGALTFNTTGKVPVMVARLDINDILPGELPAIAEKNLIREGRTDMHFRGRGAGASPAAIAAALNGELRVETGRGELLNRKTTIAGGDLLFTAFQMLNPLAEEEPTSKLVCGVLNFRIADGLATADKGIALQTDKVNALGSGIIDLETEALDIRVKPKAREGIGVGLGSLSGAVALGGTLAEPKPVADAQGMAGAAATIGGAIATGGMSLLAKGLFDRTFSTKDPCGVARGKTAAEVQAEPREAEKAEDDKNVMEKTTEGVGDTIRGLFDR